MSQKKIHIGTSGWAGAIYAWTGKVNDIFCYFDNDEAGYAVQDALRMQ